jgi:hypothetical protein
MAIQPSVGATWAVSTSSPATEDATGYNALTYTEVESIENLGAIGPTFEDVTFTPLKTGITQHRKGGKDYGQLSVSMASDLSATGQALVLSGVDGAEETTVFSHKVTLSDGSIRYFQGQIYSAPEQVGSASEMVLVEVNVMISSAIVRVDP